MYERIRLKRIAILIFAMAVMILPFDIVNAKVKEAPKIYVISQDGSGDFMTIQEGVDNSKDGDTLVIYPGIYTENVEVMGKALNIIGVDKYSCILQYDTALYQKVPLTIAAGSVKNLTIYGMDTKTTQPAVPDMSVMPVQEEAVQTDTGISSDILEWQKNFSGYALHIDQNVLRNRDIKIENCRIVSVNNHCVGIGTRGGSNITFRDCEIVSAGSGGCIYLHDPTSTDMLGKSEFVMQNCLLKSYLSPYVMTFEALEPTNSLALTFQGVRVSAVAYKYSASYNYNNVNTSIDVDTLEALERQNMLYSAGYTSSVAGNLIHRSASKSGSLYMMAFEKVRATGDINSLLAIDLPEGITYLDSGKDTAANTGIKRHVIAIHNYDGLAKNGWCGLNNAYLTPDSYGNTLIEMNPLVRNVLFLNAAEQ